MKKGHFDAKHLEKVLNRGVKFFVPFFHEKGKQKFIPPLVSVLHQNKALYNFHKRGQHSTVECNIGLEYALASPQETKKLIGQIKMEQKSEVSGVTTLIFKELVNN